MENMGIRTSNGTLNFLYRIFIADDGVREEEDLNLESGDATEVALAESLEKINSKVDSHFSSNAGKGRGKFKVDKSQLQQVKEETSKGEKEASREDEGREIE